MVGDLQLRGCAQLVRRGLAVQHMRTMVAQLEVPSMRNVCSASMDSTKTLRPVRTELPLLPPGGRGDLGICPECEDLWVLKTVSRAMRVALRSYNGQ